MLLPNNRLIVGGVDISEEYGLILMDGYTLTPPASKRYTIDVPGGNGLIDLTDALGDVAYSNRQQSFNFAVLRDEEDSPIETIQQYEKIKTRISNDLHGRRFKYQMTMDPGYIYEGRFEIKDYPYEQYTEGKVGLIKIDIEADPFKYKEDILVKKNTAGGYMFELEGGRMIAIPEITHNRTIKVIFGDVVKTYEGSGVVIDEDIVFRTGINKLYISSSSFRRLTWGELLTKEYEDENDGVITTEIGTTWKRFKTKPLYIWYKDGFDPSAQEMLWWKDLKDTVTWGEFGTKTLAEWYISGEEHEDDPYVVQIKYKRGDL